MSKPAALLGSKTLARPLSCLLVLLFTATGVLAGEPTVTSEADTALAEPQQADDDLRERLTKRHDTRRPSNSWRTEIAGRELTVSGELGVELEQISQPLQGSVVRQRDRLSTRGLEAEAFYSLSDSVSLFAQWRLLSERRGRGSIGSRGTQYVERGEMWLHSRDTAGTGLTVEFGRLKFEDERLWWWDAELDALRISHEGDEVELSFAAARELGRSRSDRRGVDPEQKGVRRWMLQATWDWQPDQSIDLFMLRHDDRSNTEQPGQTVRISAQDSSDARLTWIGAGLRGDVNPLPAQNLHYWFDLARFAGDERSVQYEGLPLPVQQSIVTGVATHKLRGWAVDAGLRWQLPLPGMPRLSVAHASTFGGMGNGPERGYRQTGLQANQYDFGGLKDLARYGATLDPELSNLRITTVGLGLSLPGPSSVDLVYHHYRQVRPSRELRQARVAAELTGHHAGVGSGLDLVATVEASPRVEFSAIVSAFRAGSAFGALGGRRYHYRAIALRVFF